MKKLTSILLAGAVLASAASCSSSKRSESIQPTTNEQGKKIVRIAYIDSDYETVGALKQSLPHFNFNKEHTAEIDYYTFDAETETENAACNWLTNDILSGKVPDLIAASPTVIERFYKNGYLTDLAELMEDYGGIQKSDLLDNVLEGITMDDGTIPGIFKRFELETSIVNSNYTDIDASSWTLDRAMKEYDSLDDKSHFIYSMNPLSEDMNYFLKGAVMSCFDYKTNEFHPSDDLAEVLGFVADMKNYESEYEFNWYFHTDDLITGEAMINFLRIYGINGWYAQEAVMKFDGAPVQLIGYPTADGGKPYAIIPSMYAIPSKAANKEGAWEFICNLLSEEEQRLQNISNSVSEGFPVIKSVIQPLLDESPAGGKSLNNEKIGSFRQGADEDPNYVKPTVTDEKKQQFVDYFTGVELYPYKSKEVEDIIMEEFQAVINGERTPEQCIEILSDRIGTYLAERE